MAVEIQAVTPDSPAARGGVQAGDKLVSINGNGIDDLLDYRFYMTDQVLKLALERRGEPFLVRVEKEEYEDLGLEFATFLMDRHRTCRNGCIFCFIDQMPKGMRDSLYFKDDDSRLSFLFGNYITLTNLTEKEIQRMIDMHISPVNISVHTTNPALRVRMMRNRFAGEALQILPRLYAAGIKMNCQLVICPGINDGEELRRSIRDLTAMHESVESIAVVPVGLTKFREGLCQLQPFDQQSAAATLDLVTRMGDENKRKLGRRIVFASDEFYLLAGRALPDAAFFEDFAQLENGVGMLSLFRDEFEEEMHALRREKLRRPRQVSVATGKAAAGMLRTLIDEAQKKWHNLDCKLYVIENQYFGERITVAGLLTATDLIAQLKGKPLGEALLISDAMLRQEDRVFLDDKTPEDVSAALEVPVCPTACNGGAFLRALLALEEE